MKKFFNEFKNFAVKGNMIDMAVGIVIGAAFNAVVNSLVKKVIMPPISLLTSGVNFTDKKWILREESVGSDEVAIGYGQLFEVLIDFAVVALTIFIVLKGINKIRAKADNPEDKEVQTPKNIELLSNLEKLMKEQNELLKKLGD